MNRRVTILIIKILLHKRVVLYIFTVQIIIKLMNNEWFVRIMLDGNFLG